MPRSERLPVIAATRGTTPDELIPRLLTAYNGDRQAVADDLGVHVNTIKHWLRKRHFRRVVRVYYEIGEARRVS